MEKTVLEQNETYVDSVHRWGRIWGLTLLVLIVAYPIAVSLIFHAQINWPAFIKGFIAIGPMYWAVGIVEIFTYVPMLGAGGSYLSFVTGNISNLKVPCALDAMERAGVKSNSEEGEVISTIAIAVSSIVTTLIILVGVVLIIPLTPLLSSPILAPAFSQILPALFGGLAVVFVSKNFRLALAPLLLMLVLFIFLAFLEGCGYLARIAFIMDRIFRRFGLSGKSFIPILIGTGCGVPGVMASRTIENERDRRMTAMITTFIPCSAKMPIIGLIAAALFGGTWWVAPSAYFLGIAAIIISGIMLKKTKMFSGDPAPFVMELPAYHLPTVGSVLRSMWERGWSFIKRAGTIILLATIVIWAGSTFGYVDGAFTFSTEMELENSVLGIIGGAICWIFSPLGFGEIKATVATIMGLVAKEEVVGVFGVLDFEGLTPLAGYAFLAFNLLCAPCFAAIGAIRREMNSAKWTWFAIGYQCGFAYVVSLIIYQVGSLFTGNVNVIGLIFAILFIALIIFQLARPYKESETLLLKNKAKASV